jgi:hypothetical protein
VRLRLAPLLLLAATLACENPVSVGFTAGGGGFQPDTTASDSTATR